MLFKKSISGTKQIKRLYKKSLNLLRKRKKIIPLSNIYKYLYVKSANLGIIPSIFHHPINLKIKGIENKNVIVRIKSKDLTVLESVFLEQYHLPPKSLPDNPTILDLGCHVGYTILHFNHLYPKARIIGIEMNKDNFNLAQVNTTGIENCFLLNKAISVKEGIIKYNKEMPEDAYHISCNDKNIENEKIGEIESISIESIVRKFKIKNIDYVKMDIEGEEKRIFDNNMGYLNWLNIVKMINIEVHGSIENIWKIITILNKYNFKAWKDKKHWSSIMAIRR